MKKLAIATLIASTFAATTAFAAEVSVEVADLSQNTTVIALDNVALPVAGFDLDVSSTQAHGDDDALTAGIDYAAPEFRGFAPYASVDYSVLEAGADAVVGEVGITRTVRGVELDASYTMDLSGADVDLGQVSAGYQIDAKLGAELEYVYDFDAEDAATVKAKATYDFTDAVYAEASYEFEADTAGLKLGYKF